MCDFSVSVFIWFLLKCYMFRLRTGLDLTQADDVLCSRLYAKHHIIALAGLRGSIDWAPALLTGGKVEMFLLPFLSLSFIHSIILLVGWITIKSQALTCCNCVTMQKNKNWEWSQAAAAERDGLMLLLKLVIVVDRGPIDQPSARWDRPAKRAEPMLGNGFHSILIIAPVRPTSESINNFSSPSSSFASMSTYLLWVLFMKMNIWCVFTLWLWARRLERWNSFYDDRHTCSQAHTMGQSSSALKCEPSAARKRSFLCSLDVRCDDDIACTIFTHFSPLQQQFFSLLL